MVIDTDLQLTQGDTSQNTPTPSLAMARDYQLGNTALNADLILVNPGSAFPDVHLDSVHGGDLKVHEVQGLIHAFGAGEESSEIQMEISKIDYENTSTYPQGDTAEAVSLNCVATPADETASPTNINDANVTTIIYSQQSPPSYKRQISSEMVRRDEKRADSDDGLNHIQTAGLARLADKEDTREELPSSLPPSSSPPHVFSSSPYASSQSSDGDVGGSNTVLAVEVEGCASSHDHVDVNGVASATQNHSRLESAEVAISPSLDEDCSQMCSITSYIVDGSKISREHDPDVLNGSRPTKRLKLDSRSYQPPAPKRVTLASQSRQFKKLTAPFRPPLKLPIITDEPTQTTNSRKVESTVSATLEMLHDKNNVKRPTITAPRKASNISRSATQFKSPLVNAVLPVDSCTIRLTPALQTLERKLQVLKRAVKVKQENEEEVLTRLAGKWIEAGREVAYDVWDATKDAGELAGMRTFTSRSHGWENNNDRNAPWGWDAKTGDTGEESCATGRLTPEEDVVIGHNTLGTMLRQLGIAPEIFGWDDNKEAFSD